MHDSPDPEPWPQVPWYIPEWMLHTPTDGVTQMDGVQTAYADPEDDPDWRAAISATRAGLAGDDDGPSASTFDRRGTPGGDAAGLGASGPDDPQQDAGSVPQPRFGPHPADPEFGGHAAQATAEPSAAERSTVGSRRAGSNRTRGKASPPARDDWFGSSETGQATAGRSHSARSMRRRSENAPAPAPGTAGRRTRRATATHGRRANVHPRGIGGLRKVAGFVRWALPVVISAGLMVVLAVHPWPAERLGTIAGAGFVLGLVTDRVLGRLAGSGGRRGRSRRPA
jgi:hypothetical protein